MLGVWGSFCWWFCPGFLSLLPVWLCIQHPLPALVEKEQVRVDWAPRYALFLAAGVEGAVELGGIWGSHGPNGAVRRKCVTLK